MEITFRPIAQWPGALTSGRQRSRFKSSYNATLMLLDAELRHLDASAIVLQVALSERDIRIDGKPRNDSRPTHPGVILAFDSKHGPLSYPCDTFDNWQDNLRAIALALEHLRAVDRYGVTNRGQQYKGWQQIEGPKGPQTILQAVGVLYKHTGAKDGSIGSGNWRDAYKTAVMKTHPDRGGNAAEFSAVQEAKVVLEKHWN